MSTQKKKSKKSGLTWEEQEKKQNALRLAVGLVKHHPENFNHLEYLKFLKSSVITTAKEELRVKQVIDPFYKNLASSERKRGISSNGEIYVYTEEELANGQVQTLTKMLQVKATVAAVLHDKNLNKLPLREHIFFIRSLSQHVAEILNFTRTSVEHVDILNSAALAIKRLFTFTHGSSSGTEDSVYSLAESGIEFMLGFMIEFLIQDYQNAGMQMQKQELVVDILYILKAIPIRRKMFEMLCSATKVGLNRIHRASLNKRNQYLLPMNDLETVLRYLMMIETLVMSLPILDHELVTLQCIQRTSLGAMKGANALIGMYATRIVEVARSRLGIKRPSIKGQGVVHARRNSGPENKRTRL